MASGWKLIKQSSAVILVMSGTPKMWAG